MAAHTVPASVVSAPPSRECPRRRQWWHYPRVGERVTGDGQVQGRAALAVDVVDAGEVVVLIKIVVGDREVSVPALSAEMPILLPPPDWDTVADPTVLALIVPDTVPEPSLSTPMPSAVTFWMLLLSIVIAVVFLPYGSINAPEPPAPSTPTPLTWLFENVTLSVPVAAESVAN